MNEKERSFRDGDREEVKLVYREFEVRIQQGNDSYRRKLEQKVQQIAMDVWSAMRSITGYRLIASGGPGLGQ